MAKLLHLFVHGPNAGIQVEPFKVDMVRTYNHVAEISKVHKSLRRAIEVESADSLVNQNLKTLHAKFPGFAAKNHPVNLIVYTDPQSLTTTLSWLQGLIKNSKQSEYKLAQVAIVECEMQSAINSNGYDDEKRTEAVELALPRLRRLKKQLRTLEIDEAHKVKAFRTAHIAISLDDAPTMALYAAQFAKRKLRS